MVPYGGATVPGTPRACLPRGCRCYGPWALSAPPTRVPLCRYAVRTVSLRSPAMPLHALPVHAPPVHALPARTATDVPEHLRDALRRAADSRRTQLAELATDPAHPVEPAGAVAAAHRASVERILGQIVRAQDRVEAGTYGRCCACSTIIPVARLELRPWTLHCVRCGMR